jgi:hypothetical protein
LLALLMQHDGPGERTGLVDEQLKVMVKLGRDGEPAGEPIVASHGLPVERHHDLAGADLRVHPPTVVRSGPGPSLP